MTKSDIEALIEDYIARVDAALAFLPVDRRQERLEDMRLHIAEARDELHGETEADVRNQLDAMGTPEALAAAERELIREEQVEHPPDPDGVIAELPLSLRGRVSLPSWLSDLVIAGAGVAAIVVVGLLLRDSGRKFALAGLGLAMLVLVNPSRIGSRVQGWAFWAHLPGIRREMSRAGFASVLTVYLAGGPLVLAALLLAPRQDFVPTSAISQDPATYAPPAPPATTVPGASGTPSVSAILDDSTRHYRVLFETGESLSRKTQVTDPATAQGNLADPSSSIARFAAWRFASGADQDLSYRIAAKQARALYSAASPMDLDAWENDMARVHTTLDAWLITVAAWQTGEKSDAELTAARSEVSLALDQAAAQVRALQ